MIKSKQELKEYIWADAQANKRKKITVSLIGDEMWKWQVSMRKLDYYSNNKVTLLNVLDFFLAKYRFRQLSFKLGFTISPKSCGKGLALPHYGSIVINGKARLGEGCKVLEGVNIGTTNGSSSAPQIGNRVFIGSGAKIIGDVAIADDVAIGANAVVVKSITEPGTTWAGVPARKISDNSSKDNLVIIQ